MPDWWSIDENVRSYLDMTNGYMGMSYLADLLAVLPEGSELLELGMGPGIDLDILSKHYKVTGTDYSRIFLDLYRDRHPGADLVQLNAVEMRFPGAPRTFDAIVSNKVLHHLSAGDLGLSFRAQLETLRPGGILCHSFWLGEGEEDFQGLSFRYWREESLRPLIPADLEILNSRIYTEEEPEDSLLLILRKISAA